MQTEANLEKLLHANAESSYWAGLIAADGSIVEYKRLKLSLKDKDHLQKFASFLEIPYNGIDCVSAQNLNKIRQFCKRFDFRPSKTYNPPRRFNLSGNNFISFLIGFIDGDGSIRFQHNRKDCFLTIKCHGSWLKILSIFHKNLSRIVNIDMPSPKINSQGYAEWIISNSIVLKFLKTKAHSLNVPYLGRKWDRIDLNYMSRQEQGSLNKIKIIQMTKQGYSKKEIGETIHLSQSAISQMFKRLKNGK